MNKGQIKQQDQTDHHQQLLRCRRTDPLLSNTGAERTTVRTAVPTATQERDCSLKNYFPQCLNYANDLPIPPTKLEEQKILQAPFMLELNFVHLDSAEF